MSDVLAQKVSKYADKASVSSSFRLPIRSSTLLQMKHITTSASITTTKRWLQYNKCVYLNW